MSFTKTPPQLAPSDPDPIDPTYCPTCLSGTQPPTQPLVYVVDVDADA